MASNRLIIGMTGASGIAYGVRLLEVLRQFNIESHLVISKAGEMTRAYETNLSSKELKSLADVVYSNDDIAAAIASGSYQTMGMIIAPCSMRTLGEIASGAGSSLMSRAADVVLKERRRLVLMTRECPLHLGHIDNMRKVTLMGGVIFPPVPAFYAKPKTLEEMVTYTVARVLDLFDIKIEEINRWE